VHGGSLVQKVLAPSDGGRDATPDKPVQLAVFEKFSFAL
jgi:hypothetical protein